MTVPLVIATSWLKLVANIVFSLPPPAQITGNPARAGSMTDPA